MDEGRKSGRGEACDERSEERGEAAPKFIYTDTLQTVGAAGRVNCGFEAAAHELLRHYFYVRYRARSRSRPVGQSRRSLYNRISACRRRLLDSGYDAELVRLYCRYLANPCDGFRGKRFLERLAVVCPGCGCSMRFVLSCA
jgi:hypothetical protein